MRKVSWHISLGLHGPEELGFSLVQLAFLHQIYADIIVGIAECGV